MEDSFQARVDKVFGSLASTSTLSALWSLTDQEIEKREWNRDTDGDTHDASPDRHDGFFTQQSQGQMRTTKFAHLEDLEGDEEPVTDEYNDASNENKKRKKHNPHSTEDEDFDIRSSIGLDCTLDYEEEEDEYDKVAVGREKAGDRLYMRDIVQQYYGTDANSHHELPGSFKDVTRDPRANHMAAKLRLKEDAETAGNFDTLKLSDVPIPPARKAQSQLDNGVTPKPILKRREISQGGKSPKHVRFHEEFVETKDPGERSSPVEGTTSQEGADELPPRGAKTTSEAFSSPQNSTSMDDTASLGKASTSYSVPDYVRNPSRYTRYTLDSTDDMDEESNQRACMDFLNLLKKPHAAEHCESLVSPPKSLIFTPKKKANDTSGIRKDNELADISKDKPFPIRIAAGYAEDSGSGSEICPMEEDKPDIVVDKSSSLQKPGRRYRTRTNVDCDDHVIT